MRSWGCGFGRVLVVAIDDKPCPFSWPMQSGQAIANEQPAHTLVLAPRHVLLEQSCTVLLTPTGEVLHGSVTRLREELHGLLLRHVKAPLRNVMGVPHDEGLSLGTVEAHRGALALPLPLRPPLPPIAERRTADMRPPQESTACRGARQHQPLQGPERAQTLRAHEPLPTNVWLGCLAVQC